MALIQTQYPQWSISTHQGAQPIGQQLIWAVIDTNIVANYFNVKYVAEVYMSNDAIVWSAAQKIGTFKTTPNNAGAGIWDLRPILETFLKPDHLGSTLGFGCTYKTEKVTIPMHLIDGASRSDNSIKYVAIIFSTEGSLTATDPVVGVGNSIAPPQHTFFNGVLQYDDVLYLTLGRYGFDLQKNNLMTSSPSSGAKRFLTNAPTTQYANLEDYGTFAFLNFMPDPLDKVIYLELNYFSSAGVLLDSENLNTGQGNGGASSLYNANTQLLYAGVFPGNLRNIPGSKFNALITLGTIQDGYYTIQAKTQAGKSQKRYTINLNCPTNLGYEPIRLTWLNQWGVWDYYTFTQKSVKSISTKRTPYTQISGTWNEETLVINGYQGGRKNFRVNTSEKIKMNTAYVTEEEGKWFEELINSPEVYILNGFDSNEVSPYNTITNKYVEPVTLTTSSYTKKTRANDRLMQYTFEVEKSKNRRTQAV
jgi:hypothetical protein